jgi:integrase
MGKVQPQPIRRRYGWVELDKKTSPQTWKGRWADWSQARVDGRGRSRPKQRSVVLGYKTKDDLPTKSAAEKKWDAVRDAVMNPPQVATKHEWTFTEFVWQHYVPDRSALRCWRPATREKFEFLMSKMAPPFGAQRLADITTAQMQKFLVGLAQRECSDTVKGSRNYLRAIFREAHEEEIIDYDPTRKLVLPKTREPRRPLLSIEQIQTIEPKLAWLDRVILSLFTRCGLRPGEVFGFKTQDVGRDCTVFIHQTFSRGRLGPTKTDGSAKKVALPEPLYKDLLIVRDQAVESGVRWLFPASRKHKGVLRPLSSANWLKRVLKPVCDDLGIAVDLRMFRRGFATVASDKGGSLKDIQHQLRHASVTTTANIYVQPVPDSVRRVVDNVDRALRDHSGPENNTPSELMTPLGHLREKAEELGSALESWWAVTGSNRGPPACKAGALTG